MGMASGESDIYFGTDVGKWGAEGAGNFFFWPAKGVKIFSTPCVYPQNAQIFVENSNMGEKDEKFRPPDPTFKSAIGCWPIHVSLVTRHSVGGGGSGAGGTAMSITGWKCLRRDIQLSLTDHLMPPCQNNSRCCFRQIQCLYRCCHKRGTPALRW